MAVTRGACVLLSGGVDSALVASLLKDTGTQVSALFVDYGQPAAVGEQAASRAVAGYFGLPWTQVTVGGLTVVAPGEIPGRNDLLIAAGSATFPGSDIAVGVHAGTGYADCSLDHRNAWQALLDCQHSGAIRVQAPLIELTKARVFALAADRGVPFWLTHSCEAGNDVCGRCLSCLDRKTFDDGA